MAALHDVKSSPSMQKARLELWVQIVVAEQDQYTPVSIEDKADCQTGGIFMLRQGEFHCVLVKVIPSIGSEKGPVMFSHITSVSLGSICMRSKNDEPLDSYQKNDVERLKEVWALAHINRLCDASEVPTTDRPSIPCSPVHWQHQPGMEKRIPLILLHLTEDANLDSMMNTGELVGENSDDMINLELIEKREHQQKMHKCEAIASLDIPTHLTDSASCSLKEVTPKGTRIYAILKVGVLLGNPSVTEIMLRKRIALKVHKRGGLGTTMMMSIARNHGREAHAGCGITFEVIFRTSNKKPRTSSLNVPNTQKPSCKVGDTVLVQLHRGLEKGIIKFVGKTNFAAGNWVGIELDHCYGKHNGTYNDEKYFECKENHGIFILKEEVIDSFSSLLIRRETCPNLKDLTRHPKYGRLQKQFPINENPQEAHYLRQGSDSPNLATATDGERNHHPSPSMITSTPVSSSSAGGVTKPEYPKTKGSLSMPSSSGSSLESDSHIISSASDCHSNNSVNDVLSITTITDEADSNNIKLTENLGGTEMRDWNLEKKYDTLKTTSPIGKPLEGTALSPVLFSQTSMRSCQVKVFGKKSDSNVHHFDFVFLKDLQSSNMAFGQRYSEWSEVVPVTFVKFEEESIEIDISADNAGWTAVCLSPNKIYQIAADSESVEQCCRIEVQWTGDGKPKQCHYPVILSGALDSPKFQLPLPLPTICNFSIGPPITSQPTLQQLLNNIAFPAEDKFIEIGLGLKFELPNLHAIEQQFNRKYSHCFLEMFDRWLKSGDDSVTWETIFNVLASESVGRDDLAKSIRRRLSSANKIE